MCVRFEHFCRERYVAVLVLGRRVNLIEFIELGWLALTKWEMKASIKIRRGKLIHSS